jgi:hypothetical protein
MVRHIWMHVQQSIKSLRCRRGKVVIASALETAGPCSNPVRVKVLLRT